MIWNAFIWLGVLAVGLTLRDIPGVHGLLCYDCQQYDPKVGCNHTTTCSRDSVCYTSFARTYPLLKSSCILKQICDTASAAIGKRSVSNHASCFNCCNTDLCNSGCNTVSTHPNRTLTTVKIPCHDVTNSMTCQTAASVVCKDVTLATNAGCRHTCGFC